MKHVLKILAVAATLLTCLAASGQTPEMMYGDDSSTGLPMSKDPHVVKFQGRYLMYYSMPPKSEGHQKQPGWTIGIAQSSDLTHWSKLSDLILYPEPTCDSKGYCAPCARVIDGKVHLFYQSYGGGPKDAICHAVSSDGVTFQRDPSNPVWAPEPADWTCGRAIDAEVYKFKKKYFLYFATRDPEYVNQLQGVAIAPEDTDFKRGDWKLGIGSTILAPELPWEQQCIEGASVIEHKGKLFMFYAGAYNNCPQQIGVAVSRDGIHWKRLSDQPFLTNGKPGEWNSSESGHPHVFQDEDGRTYLFYQGNDTNGKTWYISRREVVWKHGKPVLK